MSREENAPLVSVIVPVYKAEHYLKECVNSLLNQTFQNYEVILVNDGSPDSSGHICDEYAKGDQRIKVIHKKNEGANKARATGVEHASGQWILFVDSDDTIPTQALTNLFSKAQKESLDIAIGAWRKIYPTHKRLIPLYINGELSSINYLKALLLEKCYVGPVGKLFNRNLFDDETFNIPSEITNNEDLVMNLRLARRAHKIGAFPQMVVYNYFFRENSISQQQMLVQQWDQVFNLVEKIIEHTQIQEFLIFIINVMYRRMHSEVYKDSIYYPLVLQNQHLLPIEHKCRLYYLQTHHIFYLFILKIFSIRKLLKLKPILLDRIRKS